MWARFDQGKVLMQLKKKESQRTRLDQKYLVVLMSDRYNNVKNIKQDTSENPVKEV